MPVIDTFFVIQFENDDYFKSFKLDGSGYKTSKGLHSASKFTTMSEALVIANELHTEFKVTSAIRQIEIIIR
ncbi:MULTISPECIES: hypothetical protein [Bacillus amyloliquefaciens group]|uniref:hypothetical protein n=1 Tax=Bacillus amyloliquefaciens group TaxID=1938374 RepID=UPI0002059753|nr:MULTISPECIES: hypothetical protein [Bacillus amyloliquefaciens group]AIW34091.1 hypothetical protein KS08_10740 [Bacillus subtilis]AEB23451.1 hypothetical protein BAMTA208_06380 [Bacillus amyloliquefaciens TA208]MEC0967123.1 hypothetical protein [Bacillus amyloliquefaciens]MEC1832800.1 hypothetical protein [Bacillus amyloliquefaciens]MEC1836305.1 hypothetical protein [Bacillus amyloliquefaciens]